MSVILNSFTVHVPNVWQTCEWYREVFGLEAIFASDATAARLDTASKLLTFAAHSTLDEQFGIRRINSFLSDPPAVNLNIATADVAALFARALTHGAVPILEPAPDAAGNPVASLRDLNGFLIQLVTQSI